MIITAKIVILIFGVFLILVGFLMFFKPKSVRSILQKAGSTSFINYAEITIRMIPAIAMVIYAEYSKHPDVLKTLGWFIITTSLLLYAIPRRIHHAYSLKSAEILKPRYFQLISPFSIFFGALIIYTVI